MFRAVEVPAPVAMPDATMPVPPLPTAPAVDTGPRMRVVPSRGASAPLAKATTTRASTARSAFASWILLAASVALFVVGGTLWSWSAEMVALDAALMPLCERHLGCRPPLSFVGDGTTVADLRHSAGEASDAGDIPAAIVLWKRVKAREAKDAGHATDAIIAKLLADLDDSEGRL